MSTDAVKTSCPACGKRLQARREHLGKKAKCARCGCRFVVRSLAETAETASLPDAAEPAAAPPPPPPSKSKSKSPGKIDRFVLLDVLGEGAFGTVYRAHDPQLDRLVALKVPRSGVLAGQKARARFLREARAAAQLHHPNIVAVHDAKSSESIDYIASALIDGQPLDKLIATGKRFTLREATSIVEKLARALSYAHQRGVVHRDVKPANILIDAAGEPHLADFGLARRDEADALKTQEDVRLGTPAYMSPEQASGRSAEADGRSDQWSLGVILYELLGGCRPFRGGHVESLLDKVRNTVPYQLKQIDDSIPADLATLCEICLSRSPEHRFDDCEQLADELARWRRGEPITSRPISSTERLVRWCRREPVVASLAGLTMALCLVATATAVGLLVSRDALVQRTAERDDQADRAQRAQDAADDEARKKEQARLDAMEKEQEATRQAAEAAAERERRQLAEDQRQRLADAQRQLVANIAHKEEQNKQLDQDLQGKQEELDDKNQALDEKEKELAEKTVEFDAAADELSKQVSRLATDRLAAYIASLENADSALAKKDWRSARLHLASSPEDFRGWEWAVMSQQALQERFDVAPGAEDVLSPRTYVATHPNVVFATNSSKRLIGFTTTTYLIVPAPSRDERALENMVFIDRFHEHDLSQVDAADFVKMPEQMRDNLSLGDVQLSPRGLFLATYDVGQGRSRRGDWEVYDLQSWQTLCGDRLDRGEPPPLIDFSLDDSEVIVATRDGRVRIFATGVDGALDYGEARRRSRPGLAADFHLARELGVKACEIHTPVTHLGWFYGVAATIQSYDAPSQLQSVAVFWPYHGEGGIRMVELPFGTTPLEDGPALGEGAVRITRHPSGRQFAVSANSKTVFVDCDDAGQLTAVDSSHLLGFPRHGATAVFLDRKANTLRTCAYKQQRLLPVLGALNLAYEPLIDAASDNRPTQIGYDATTSTVHWIVYDGADEESETIRFNNVPHTMPSVVNHYRVGTLSLDISFGNPNEQADGER